MTDLIAKLEAAEAGSRELDAEIFRAFDGALPEEFAGRGIKLVWQDDGSATMPVGDMQVRYDPPRFTTSLDAALALAERLGLDVSQLLNDALEGPMGEGLWATGWDTAEPIVPQIARFVCIAILRAKEAQA